MNTPIRIIAFFACLTVASSAFASSGTLMFSGIIAEPTCKISSQQHVVDTMAQAPSSQGTHAASVPLTMTVSSCASAYSKLHTWFDSAQSADLTTRLRGAFARDAIDHASVTMHTADGHAVDFAGKHVTQIPSDTGESSQNYVADYAAARDQLVVWGMTYSIVYE